MEFRSSLESQSESDDTYRSIAGKLLPSLSRVQSLALVDLAATIKPKSTPRLDSGNASTAATQVRYLNLNIDGSDNSTKDREKLPVLISGLAGLREITEAEIKLRDAKIVTEIADGALHLARLSENVERPTEMIERLFVELKRKVIWLAESRVCDRQLGNQETMKMGVEKSFLYLSGIHGRAYVSYPFLYSTVNRNR